MKEKSKLHVFFAKIKPIRKIYIYIAEKKYLINLWFQVAFPIIVQRIKQSKAVFLLLTPEHGNLGDHAIAKAETDLLNEIGVKYIEITDKKLNILVRNNWLNVLKNRTILVSGGGNLGTLWFNIEKNFRELINKKKKSSILCLPNTIFYEQSEWGKKELENSIEIYNAHPNLKLYAREMTSYDLMNKIYNNVSLVPDMVLSMNKSELGLMRKGCLLCLRNDLEKTRSEETEIEIIKQAKNIFKEKVKVTDMSANHTVPIDKRDFELEKKFNEFKSAELVITDRLHGMIFCAITGTPCIVIDSKSPKVRGCYEWIKDLPYIKFANEAAEIEDLYNTIPKQEFLYDNSSMIKYYELLKKDILFLLK